MLGISGTRHQRYKEDSVPQPIDVGSILGGRYKVTGRILASAENDVILDGLDQVLNRPVSILVSAPANSENLTHSAREVATGERVSNVSILDLGQQDGSAYLIASRTTPADLLDLVVPTEPSDAGVYQEPFFTDTLGTEIFGSARDAAPSAGPYVYEDNSPVTPARPAPPVRRAPAPPAPTAAVPSTPARQAPKPLSAVVPPTSPWAKKAPAPTAAAPIAQAATPAPAPAPALAQPKVSLWDEDDYGFINEGHNADAGQGAKAGTFPAELRAASDNYDSGDYGDELDEDDSNAPRTSGRWLTGIVVTVLVVAALFFAVSHIGSLFNGTPVANGGNTNTATGQSSSTAQATSAAPAPVVVPPAIKDMTDITTYAPGVQHYGDMFIPRLKDAIDGNKGTYWPTVEYSDDTFAHFTNSIDLAIELQQEATVGSVTINQIAGSGGQFNILTNSKPSLDGAVKIGSGSFTAPDFTLKAAAGVKAKYVIISFTQLPRLQPFVTYPYGLKIAEISIK